ncbi:MAG: gliding motility-associated C-terminal domain-containing protein [Bacteroidetes bacterium]|nr:gliding motility-associated C-terminal domain-containing protein [Bacteroidota bacterium]
MNKILRTLFILSMLLVRWTTVSAQTAQGTDFWVSSTYPFYGADSFSIAIASEKPTKAWVEIPLMGWKDSVSLGYNEIKTIRIPSSIRSSYYYYYTGAAKKVGDNAIHVTSALPTKVYSFADGRWYSCGATAVYPTSTQPPGGVYYPYKSRYAYSGGSYKVFFFSVIGIDDSVTVSFSSSTTMMNLPPGNSIVLRKGQMARFYAYVFGLDPTLAVSASQGKRIAVFTENFYDYSIVGCYQYDLMYEQILPSNVCGNNFVLSPFKYHKKGYEYSVIAMEDGTTVQKDGNNLASLNKGEVYFGRIYSDSSTLITSDKPVNCFSKNILDSCAGWWWGNYYTGPSLMTMSTGEQMITDATVSVPNNANFNQNYVNILTSAVGRDSTWLDGMLIPASEFKGIINNTYYLYRDTLLAGNHRIMNPYGFISYMYGRGYYGGYAYNASAGLQSLKRVINVTTYKSCDTGRIVKLTSTGDPAKNFQWTLGTQKDTGLTAYFQVPKEGTYFVKLKYQTIRNNKWDSVVTALKISGTEKLDFVVGNDFNFCKSSYKFTLPKTKLFRYKWSTGDTTPFLNVAANGTYTLQVTNTSTGCKFYDTAKVTLHDKLIPDFTIRMKLRCPGIPIYLTNTSTVSTKDSISKYEWFADGLPHGNKKDDTVGYAYPGTYVFKLKMTSRSTCVDSVVKEIKVSDKPTLKTGHITFDSCYGRANIRFNSKSGLSVGKITSYRWIFSDGDTTYKKVQAIRDFKDSGNYWYQFAAYSDAGCGDTSAKKYFKIYGAPGPDFTVPDSSVCLTGNFFAVKNKTKTNNQSVRYEWQWGDGTGETFDEPGFKNYSDTGNFTIRLVAAYNSTGCSDTLNRKVRVNPNPKAVLNLDSSNYCLNKNYFHFTDKSDAKGSATRLVTWKWGDGKTTKDTTPYSKKYSAPGTFRVKLYFSTGKGCLDSAQKNVTVYNSPKSAFVVADSNVCGNANYFNFTNNSTAPVNARWSWNYGDGNTSTAKSPGKVSWGTYGTYTVKLAVLDPLYGCSDTAQRTLTILAKPKARMVISDTVVCDTTRSITFADSSNYGNLKPWRKWVFNSKATDTSFQPQTSRIFLSKGNQTAMLMAGLAGVCTDTAYGTVRVKYIKNPVQISHTLKYACAPGLVDFFANPGSGTGWTWQWDLGTGTIYTSQNPSGFSYPGAGKYKIILIATDGGGCSYTSRDSLELFAAPKVTLTALNPDTQCLSGNAYVFRGGMTSAKAPVVWQWNLDESKTSALQQTPAQTYSNIGTKNISLKATDANGCADSTTKKIYLNPSPAISYSGDSACEGVSRTLSATVTPAGVAVQQIQWWIDGSAAGSGNTLNYTFTPVGLHTLQAVVTASGGCKDTGMLQSLRVYPRPVAKFGIDMKNAIGTGVPVDFLDSSTGATQWTWTPEPGQTGTGKTFNWLYSFLGPRQALLQVSNTWGCTDTTSRIFVLKSEELIYVPTSFTPNNDGRNDDWGPRNISAVKEYSLRIFNRWGQVIYETRNPMDAWDGTYKGEPVPDGAYSYDMYMVFLTRKKVRNTGTVTVLR